MHRDLARYLVLLTVVRVLVAVAAPAPHPWPVRDRDRHVHLQPAPCAGEAGRVERALGRPVPDLAAQPRPAPSAAAASSPRAAQLTGHRQLLAGLRRPPARPALITPTWPDSAAAAAGHTAAGAPGTDSVGPGVAEPGPPATASC